MKCTHIFTYTYVRRMFTLERINWRKEYAMTLNIDYSMSVASKFEVKN